MRLKRFTVLALVLFLFGSVTVFADDVYEYYKGKPVQILVNNQEISSNGLIIDDKNGGSRTMLPLRAIASTLQALVSYDSSTQTVNVYKPNVHMAFQAKDKTVFSVVTRGEYEFAVFSQIDSLKTNVSGIKIEVEDPYGNVVASKQKELTENKESFWWAPTISVNFKYSGDYAVHFFMKTSPDSSYVLVSEKMITCLSD
ncbi:stalk domain-containing protein [Ferviditalea candida]|uniref:Stalk domain-containing protein n=1 Tax=Ferviditalea candida TaxID=3108399 RepID=A0ABU5ZKB7_9BACL|nr:stalk domain-containing protein [Paenibacillaceae bacterium T2]